VARNASASRTSSTVAECAYGETTSPLWTWFWRTHRLNASGSVTPGYAKQFPKISSASAGILEQICSR
jgi:hypothetical protein